MATKVQLEISDELLEIYQQYAKKHDCDLDQALLVPIRDLAPVFARDFGLVDIPQR